MKTVHPLRTVGLGPGIMGMRVVSSVAGAVGLNHFRDVSSLLTGLRVCKRSSDLAAFFFYTSGGERILWTSFFFHCVCFARLVKRDLHEYPDIFVTPFYEQSPFHLASSDLS